MALPYASPAQRSTSDQTRFTLRPRRAVLRSRHASSTPAHVGQPHRRSAYRYWGAGGSISRVRFTAVKREHVSPADAVRAAVRGIRLIGPSSADSDQLGLRLTVDLPR